MVVQIFRRPSNTVPSKSLILPMEEEREREPLAFLAPAGFFVNIEFESPLILVLAMFDFDCPKFAKIEELP